MLIRSQDISIHVPAWGTTNESRWQSQSLYYFNPRSRVGNDQIPSAVSFTFFYFNPRSRVGNDVGYLYKESISPYFNPRSRVGNDSKFSQIFFVFLCNKYNFSTFYYPFSLFFGVIHVTFLIFVVRILPAFYVYF